MKNIVALITLILCCFSLFACQGDNGVVSYDGTEGLDFYLLPDGTYGVAPGKATYLEEIVIPAEYNNRTVSRLLYHNSSHPYYKTVVLPSTITIIDDMAFYGCDKLETLIFKGTMEQWNAIEKTKGWNNSITVSEVICSDGTVPLIND